MWDKGRVSHLNQSLMKAMTWGDMEFDEASEQLSPYPKMLLLLLFTELLCHEPFLSGGIKNWYICQLQE